MPVLSWIWSTRQAEEENLCGSMSNFLFVMTLLNINLHQDTDSKLCWYLTTATRNGIGSAHVGQKVIYDA